MRGPSILIPWNYISTCALSTLWDQSWIPLWSALVPLWSALFDCQEHPCWSVSLPSECSSKPSPRPPCSGLCMGPFWSTNSLHEIPQFWRARELSKMSLTVQWRDVFEQPLLHTFCVLGFLSVQDIIEEDFNPSTENWPQYKLKTQLEQVPRAVTWEYFTAVYL